MKTYIILGVLFALSTASTIESRKEEPVEQIPIEKQEIDSGFDGTFTNNYKTGNGIVVEQSGNVKTVTKEEEMIPVQEIIGSYSYTAPDGTPVKINYVANEQGFQAQGDVLPQPPSTTPLPVAIARALKFIEEHPPKKE